MIEENNASSGAVESSAQQSQAEAKPAQSELTAQDILAASTVQTELSAGNQDTGKSRWYIVHTYSGFEQRVEATIKEMMRNAQDNGLIHEVVVPTEKVIELGKGGAKRTTTRKFYPGYIMLRMTMTDFSWHLVQSIPKVTGFVGGKNRPRKRPASFPSWKPARNNPVPSSASSGATTCASSTGLSAASTALLKT